MSPELEAGVQQLDIVRRDLIAEQASGGGVMSARHDEPASEIPQTRHNDQRNLFPFPPRNGANLPVRNEPALRPDAVRVEPSSYPPAQGHEIPVIQKHHP